MRNIQTVRRRRLRGIAGLSVAVAAALAVSACSGPSSSSDAGRKGGSADTVEVAIGYNNTSSWDPLNTGSAFAMAAEDHVYESLWDDEPVTRKPYAALAADMPADLNATEWTVKLRDGATWQDGKPVTADDVVYSFGRVLAEDPLVLTHAFFTGWLDSVTKVDDQTVRIKLKFPFPSALERFAIVKIMPKHVFDGKSDDFLALPTNAVGSGPYKVTDSQEGSFTSFQRYDAYNGPLEPKFEKMRWNASVDSAARISLLMSNGVEIAENIPPETVDSLRKVGLEAKGVDSMNLLGLAFNTNKKPFNDKRVRQALRMAIDTPTLIDVALNGQATPATGFLQESSPQYRKAATQYDYNPEKAKQLLAEAGVKNLKVRLLSTDISWTKIADNTIKESWDAIGVETTLDIKDTGTFNTLVAGGDPADVLAFSGNPTQFGADADLNIRWFYSTSTPFLPWNHWDRSPEYKALDAKLEAAQRETDEARRDQLVNESMDMIAEEGVIYPVLHMKLFTAWHPDELTGVTALDIPGVNLLGARQAG